MLDERCVNCPVIAECNIAVGYGSVVCVINKMRSGITKETIMEHDYDNCHNLTCRRRCEEDGYNKAINDFVGKFIYKAVCEGCSGCCNCYEEGRQSECEDWNYYMKMAEQLKNERS